jgi:hypothetical protein
MRLPLVAELDSRDGESNKDSRMTNALKETDEGGELVVVRPGLVTQAVSSGNGNGLVNFNGELVSVFGATLGESPTSTTSSYQTYEMGLTGTQPTFFTFSPSAAYLSGYINQGLDIKAFSYRLLDGAVNYSSTLAARAASSQADAVTDDGVIYAAYSPDQVDIYRFDSISGVATNLGNLDSLSVLGEIEAADTLAISEDGATIVGTYVDWDLDETYSSRLFRWTSETGFTDLGEWSGGNGFSRGTITGEGNIIILFIGY